MDFIEEDEMMEGGYGEEFGGDDRSGHRDNRQLRGPASPLDVLFSVFLDQPPKPTESVILRGSLPELAEGVPMRQCETGRGRLWRASVQVNPSATATTAAASASNVGGILGSISGVLGGGMRGAPALALFEVTYSVQSLSGQTVRQEEDPFGEPGPLRPYYFHRARFPGADQNTEEAFPLFVHDEVHLLQSGTISAQDFLARFQQLAQASFARKRSLLDVALEELITIHWGVDARPPPQLVLAIAATLGYFRRQHNHGPTFSPIYDRYEDPPEIMGLSSSSAVAAHLADKEREREAPQSLTVCRWIVQHCPARDAAEEEDRWEDRDRDREGHGNLGTAQLRRYTQLGVLQAAETLYIGEKTFEWLKLLNFLPEHALPPPLNASQFTGDEREKLVKSFVSAMDQVFNNFRRQRQNLPSDNTERATAEGLITASLETFLRGLITFCPSVDSLHKLIKRVMDDHQAQMDIVTPMVWHRLRSVHFGPQDKEALKNMIRSVPFMSSDDCAIALLTNQYHPSEEFTHAEIIQFVKGVTYRAAGPQLQSATRRWLMRYYGRPPDRPERKDERQALNKMSRSDYAAQKEEIREAIQKAIRGWHMVLALPCFKQEEETLRMILFELSQAYFFKDPDPLMVLDCMLELEEEIRTYSSVKQLEVELQRIAIKSVRDAQDTSETEHHEELLRLLFDMPTPLRFVIIEAFIGFRQAALNLNKLLDNKPIWSRLLSAQWINARGINEFPLGQTQRNGQNMLQQSATLLMRGSITLNILHTILAHQKSYETLIKLVPGDTPNNIPESAAKLHKFDDEFKQLRTYVKMFCAVAQVEATDLEQLIESIRVGYSSLELTVAVSKFEGLPVRPHLPWLQSLKGSDVFLSIWKDVARTDPHARDGMVLRQEHVVSSVIPKARIAWEKLAKSIESGTAVLKDIRWCVDLQWAKVQLELELLESTAPRAARWVPAARELTKAMRLAAKLREWAPSMLDLREVLSELFQPVSSDPCVDELKAVVKQYEHFWDMRLQSMLEQVEPYNRTISMLSEAMQDYTIIAAKHDKSLKWLVKHKSTEDFNRLLSLCRPNTDDALILGAIASLQQTRTFLAEVLYTKPPYRDLRSFLEELAGLHVDETTQASLQSVQTHFDPMLDLLTTHSRTPGVQACYDLKKIYEAGTFQVICTTKESEQIVCRVPDSEFNYEALAELRRQLLMTDVPTELDGAKNIHEMLLELVEKFSLLEEYGRCAMELFQLGHFAYRAGQQVLCVYPRHSVVSVQQSLKDLQQKLAHWKVAVDAARGRHYFLNYFTVRELCHLVEHIPLIQDKERGEEVWNNLWPLLRVVDLKADAASVRSQVQGKLGRLTSAGTSEVAMLNSLGELLDGLFQPSVPQVRLLDGLQPVRQQLQGDLLIRSMQNREQGVPVFVCCADDASKVTELVLSIYTRRERVPEAEELLLCSGNTTLEEIELLLRRFFSARKHQREDRLYCLGNIHLLPYVVQCGTVEALRHLEEKCGFANASALVFVSGQQNQMLTNALNRHNLAVSVLPNESLTEAVSRVGEKYHGRQMEAVAAQMNGVGKTHYIYRQVHALQERHRNEPLLHHVEIRETTNISSLVTALLSDPTNPQVPTAIHIDLAHILPSHVDTLLFELLIVGTLRDPQHCAVYHRRSQDFFFVEIPNTPGEATAKQLSFCLLLPRVFLRMGPDKVDTCKPVFTPMGGAVLIDFKHNDRLEIVGKTLQAMKVEAFNPKSKDFNVAWTANTAPIVPAKEVYNLLLDVCCSETSPPSFLVFTNFINFLGNLVKCAEEWNMLNLHLLQQLDAGMKSFKHCFSRLLIETSRDFALRQVPKMSGDLENSPLAPRLPQQQVPAGRVAGGPGRFAPRSTHQAEAAASIPASSANGAAAGPPVVGSDAASSSSPAPRLPAGNYHTAPAEEAGVGRPDVSAYVARFDQMPSWESCVHPIASFKKNEMGSIVGCSIMSLQRNFLGNFIGRELQTTLNLNQLRLEKDWSKVTHAEAMQLVHHIEGGDLLRSKDHLSGPKDYVVTVDNLLKFMSIQQRLKYGLPVILMGETGCGKTALVKFLAKTLDFRLFTLNIHGGITDETIINFIGKAIKQADSSSGVLVFFDEINAANCMALFKTIIIDRMYGTAHIPEKVRIIACCNPYRRRRNNEVEEVALVFQHHTTELQGVSGISDPMKRLVYRVHPLPESLVDVVSDFGALSEKSEEIYIDAILRKELPRLDIPFDENNAQAQAEDNASRAEYEAFLSAFKELLCQSQIFVREVNLGERSVVSMRDIARAARVFKWFLTYYSKLRGSSLTVSDDKDGAMRINVTVDMKPHLRSAIILTLGYCYHSRLNREQRYGYRKRVCDTWARMNQENPAVNWLKLDSAADLEAKLTKTQYEFVSQMELGEGIALNEALRENLFMLLVSIMNQIPILLIGKPGCSKSLAMGVLQNNLNGEVSNKEFFKSMPAVEVFAYQCSPLSTPEAILSAFQSARQSNLGHKSTIVCVLLDEVGLAEESPHLPLKVLHKELEDLQGIACVGISNWALDAAKMSRCVTLYRPPPTVEDLCVTAEGMVASSNLKAYLTSLSEAFFQIYKTQKRADFWGMREFYSTVRVINAELKLRASKGQEAVVEPQVLMKTVQRNFGGQPDSELERCIEEFFERVSMSYEEIPRYTTSDLIQQNLSEPDARHLMLLTKNNAALRLLFESGLLDHSKAEVMFGSTFPNDQSDVFVAMNLQRIKSFMQQPISLVMVHCDSLYESLYDLLNQHYMEYAGQRYVRIAHGSKAKQCPINRLFRVIVITEISDAYFRLAPPLLNRFEKQIFLRKDLMTRADEALLKKLTKFWELLLESVRGRGSSSQSSVSSFVEEEGDVAPKHNPIAGHHPELLSSLVFTLRRRCSGVTSIDELYVEARQMLTLVLTPEAVCIAAARFGPRQMQLKFGFDIVTEYFHKQRHSDLPTYAQSLVADSLGWCDSCGAQVMVMTYSPIRGKIGKDLQKALQVDATEVSLHELSSSHDIEKAVKEFYGSAQEHTPSAKSQRFLLIHADPAAASLRMIEHCRFVCEKSRNEFMKRLSTADKAAMAGNIFVILVVHLQRGSEGSFSFDFDSQWRFVFLDSVEPSTDLNSMPALGSMLNMPLIEVVQGLDFPKLLKKCFRSSLSRLIYPHSRKPEDLQRQIQQILMYLEDAAFIHMVREWIIRVLEQTPKNAAKESEGSVGDDKNWFAAIATAAHELALAGTFRAALHNRIIGLVGSLLTVLLAHLDRNGGLALLSQPSKRDLWISIATASLTSPLSARLQHEAVTAINEAATAQHEVGTDAQTGARPFPGRFPSSWFVSRSIDGVRHIIESLPPTEQLPALVSQYQLSKLHEVGLKPIMDQGLLDDYISDFTAMHVDWTPRIGRETQQQILRKTIQRIHGKDLKSILEVHQLFWIAEKRIAYCNSLLNSVPDAVPGAARLIDTADMATLNLDLMFLVHQTLTGELNKPSTEGPPQIFYQDWLTRKMVVAGLTKDLVASHRGQQHEKLTKLKTDTEPRIETLGLLLQHIAHPLKLPLDIVRQFLADLPEGKVRHTKTFHAILKLAQRIESFENGLVMCSAFIESWVLDVCLRDAEAISDLEESCLRLFCSLSAGLPVMLEPNTINGVVAGSLENWHEQNDCPIFTLPRGGGAGGAIPRSPCLNLALLRKLIVRSEGDAKRLATARIEELLGIVSKHERHNDTTLATKYAVLCEESAALSLQKLPAPTAWPDLSLVEVFRPTSNPARMLQDVGRIRWMLTQYSKVLCSEPLDQVAHDAILRKVDPLLQTTDERLAQVCRSMRLYLLKCIERVKGISSLRGMLADKPLCDAPWVVKWRDLHDIDFYKFIGAALVPKWNPFTGGDETPEYAKAKVAVIEMMNSTATVKLDQFAKDCAMHTKAQKKRDIGGLLMALCQEPGLLAALQDEDRQPPWRHKLNEWLATTKELPVNDQERTLLRIFAGDDAILRGLREPDKTFLRPFSVSINRKMEQLLRWRLLGHLAGALIAAPPTSLLSALRTMMLEPATLMPAPNSIPIFLPGMDEDIRNRVMKALLERGENIWKFKSHWYKCSCGYTFFIGECGRPMEVTSCPGCGTAIGGRDHNKTSSTTEDDETDRSPFGYMLPTADKDDKHISFRDVPSTSARAVRLLLHGSMYLGLVSHASDPMPRIFDNIVNKDSMCTMRQDIEAKYISEHFVNDWQNLVENLSSNCEDLAAAMHALLKQMSEERRDEAKTGASDNLSWERLQLNQRNAWEEVIESKYLGTMVSNYDTSLGEIYKKWGGAEEDGKFVSELKEAADVRDFPVEKREAELPQMWAYRSPVTLDALHARLGVLYKASEVFPVLCTVLQQPLFPVLKALGCLVGVFEWHSLAMTYFSGRITRSDAGNLKVGDFLAGLQPTERIKWESAYEHFEKAWHVAWRYVERHECFEISDNLKKVMVSRDSAMVWCIADSANEGICPLALTQWLVERHNELVQVVSAAIGYPPRKVSSRLLVQHDVVSYDENELMRFLQTRCVTYGVGGKLNFDFQQLEQQLRRELARPEITVEIKSFQWLGESFSAMHELRTVVKQRELSPEIVDRLKAELTSPSLANMCLQKVQMSVSFILKSGGALSVEHAGEMLLSEYLRSVLSESLDSLPSATARSEVHLWHVDSFAKLLRQIMNKDPMDSIDPKYKVGLPRHLEVALQKVKHKIPEVFLEVLGSTAESRLTETYIGEEISMTEMLTHLREMSPDIAVDPRVFDDILELLPLELQMKHWAAVYWLFKQQP